MNSFCLKHTAENWKHLDKLTFVSTTLNNYRLPCYGLFLLDFLPHLCSGLETKVYDYEKTRIDHQMNDTHRSTEDSKVRGRIGDRGSVGVLRKLK